MSKVSIAGREFDVEVVSENEQVDFRLVVEYETVAGDRYVERTTLEATGRAEISVEALSTTLADWEAAREVDEVLGFAVVEERLARRAGEFEGAGGDALLVDPEERSVATAREPGQGSPAPSRYVEGDHLIYYEGGPDSSVYGHTTEGLVAEAPPIEHQHRENEPDKVRLDVGGRTKLVPLEWVVGLAGETDVDLDKPRDL
ncbi:hypothetical protein [Halorientalis halophila]|uniref:hypothetical protein n=1 Tax=Halorientalis halophila TaxID=3108499 RepID=UPI00300AF12F